MPEARSRATALTSLARATPDARSTPSAPSSRDLRRSSPVFTPAPQRTLTFGSAAFTMATESETTSGCALLTEMSPPMSSGGSTATKVGLTAAAALETVSKALQAVVPFVPIHQRARAREAVERALDDRSAVLLAGMRWWLDTLALREGEA